MNDLENFSKLSIEEDLKEQELYGGALKISIPQEWRDVSDIRQVPDHQEVYQDCTFAQSNSQTTLNDNILIQGTGACLIVEILERQDEVSDEDASSFFFNDLADANKSDQTGVTDERKFEYSNIWIIGHEEDNKNAKAEEEKMDDKNLIPKLSARVKACTCIGIQTVGPMRNQKTMEEGKSSKVRIELCAIRLESVQTDLLISLSMPIFSSNQDDQIIKAGSNGHSSLFKSMLKSFEVVDWTLFC